MEDWQWKEDKPGHIRVERRPTLVPKEMKFIPRLVQGELPRDLRDFLHLKRPDDDPQNYHWASLDRQNTRTDAMGRGLRLYIEQQRMAIEPHFPALQMGEKFYVGGLILSEKQHLLIGMMVHALARAESQFLQGDLGPYIADPSSASLELKGSNMLFIGTRIELENGSVGAGFGWRVAIGK